MNSGGCTGSFGIVERGSPVMFRRMRNPSGTAPKTGLIFCATGLYLFFVPAKAAVVEADRSVIAGVIVEAGCCAVDKNADDHLEALVPRVEVVEGVSGV